MSKEPDPVVRASLSLRASMWKEIRAYCDREGIVTVADGVRRLLQIALRVEKRKAEK